MKTPEQKRRKSKCCNFEKVFTENKYSKIFSWKCGRCGRLTTNPYLGAGWENNRKEGIYAKCSNCGNGMKPNVKWRKQ